MNRIKIYSYDVSKSKYLCALQHEKKISSLYFNLIHYHIIDTFFANNIIDTLTYIMDVMFIIK
jgi:hypothetical protein